MIKPTLEERFLGCLIGTAVGDALGAPFEHQELPKELTPKHILKEFIRIPGFPKGQYTDDTQLTIATAESIITKRKIDGQDIAQKFTKLWKNHQILGQGIACDEAIHRMIHHHVPWSEAGAPEGEAGNGAAMRISPIGLWNHDQTGNLPADTYTASIITHKDKKSIAGALAIATAISYLTNNSELDTDRLLDQVSRNVFSLHQGFAQEIHQIKTLLSQPEEQAIEQIIQKAQFGPHKGSWCGRITPYVIPTVLLSLHNLLRYPDNYAQAVAKSILAGGDTDTTAAITGALSGTHNGIKAIPQHLAQAVLNSKYIHELGKQLLQAKTQKNS